MRGLPAGARGFRDGHARERILAMDVGRWMVDRIHSKIVTNAHLPRVEYSARRPSPAVCPVSF